jgi:aminoglycoside/choline kinase family phosphotransferase
MNIDDRADARLDWTRNTLGDTSLTLAPASTDASFRSYWRTAHAGQSWIVMDSPPAQEDPMPWLAMGRRLAAAGLHVPRVRDVDEARGFLLIEDLGSQLYLPELNDATVDTLYGDAMDALLRMQSTVDTDGMAIYNRAFLAQELEIMPTWFVDRHLGCTLAEADCAILESAFDVLLHNALEQPRRFVHRDFHSRNLLVVDHARTSPDAFGAMQPGRTPPPLMNPGIIDFQGALLGPITYDLASLLRDCYIAWEPERVHDWVETYRLRLLAAGLIDSNVDRPRFLRWFDLTGLQRHLKVLGIFCRLHYRDGKRSYLDDLPRVYHYVLSVARGYPELRDLVSLLQCCVGERDLSLPEAA